MPQLERDGEIFVLHLAADKENRFHPDWLTAGEAALDRVQAVTGPERWSPRAAGSSGPTAWTPTGCRLTVTSTRPTLTASTPCSPAPWPPRRSPSRRSMGTPSRRGQYGHWPTTCG